VNSIEELLIAFQMATAPLTDGATSEETPSKGRFKIAVAESLLVEANELIQSGKTNSFTDNGDSEVMSVLGRSLLQKLQAVRNELQHMISSAQQAVASMDMDSLAAADRFCTTKLRLFGYNIIQLYSIFT